MGYYCPVGSTVPIPCGAGTYSNVSGLATCLACPAGYYCLQGANTFIDTPCPSGRYCPEGTTFGDEFRCPRGSYYNETGAKEETDCLSCPGGMYCEIDGLSSYTGPCDPGTWSLCYFPINVWYFDAKKNHVMWFHGISIIAKYFLLYVDMN